MAQNTPVQLSYQVCPIILTGGAANQVPGGMLPLLSLFGTSPVGGPLNLPFDINDLDDAFGAFNVLPGGTLVSQQVAKYPFANQWVAANATIREPLTLSVIMDAPMRGPDAWAVKRMVMSALKATLDTHNNIGGTYTVVTPAYMYENLIMTSLTDNSRGNNSLPQNAWRFDFEKPLVAISDLYAAQNQYMSKISNQLPVGGEQSGIQPGVMTGQTQLGEVASPATGLPIGSLSNVPMVGTLTGGSPVNVLNFAYTMISNFPAQPNPANFPYIGIS